MVTAGIERKTNPSVVALIQELRKASAQSKVDLWADVAERLSRPNRNWAQVNVDKVSQVAGADEIALVPGKVLSTGEPRQGLKVAAVNFSAFAREKIEKAGGTCLTIPDAVKLAPKGQGVRIVA